MSDLPAIFFQQYFEVGPPMVILQAKAPEFKILAANPAFLKITGTAITHMEGKSLWDAFPANPEESGTSNRDIIEDSLLMTIKTKTAQVLRGVRHDIPLTGTDKFDKRYWQFASSPVMDGAGEVTSLIYNVSDITEAFFNANRQEIELALNEQNNDQLQRQFMRAPIGMVFINRDGYSIDYINQAMRRLWNRGLTENLIGQSVFEVIPELEQQGYHAIFDEVLATGRAFKVQETPLQYKRTDRVKTFYLDLSIEPLYDTFDHIYGAVGFAVDVTDKVLSRGRLQAIIDEKKLVEDELRHNEERLVQILETMAEGVGIIDANGKLTYANPMAQKILGLHESEILGNNFGERKWKNFRTDGSPLPDEEHPMAIMMKTGQPVYDHEIAVQPPDRERFYISINAAPIRDNKNKIVAGIATFMDVTARRKIVEQKDEFISVASHELKTPLTSLKLSMQLLSKLFDTNPTSPQVAVFIAKANNNLSRLVHLTEDLMNISKIDNGKLPLKKARFNLFKLAHDCCEYLTGDDAHAVVIEGEPGLQVYADEQRIDQVIVNFVNNAVKYAPESKKIILKVQQLADCAMLSVQDFGIGIPAEKVPHLFERYYRVNETGIQFSGLGLGLYISAEIIERHGGQIGVNSDPGNGSTFWFTLPIS
ncbi:PAS domain-containing sensor histidine kinase [Mucilaginibacter segetis]|uniref:histidine kinase n=1 Tax=Mucilaginibacter segetis TaxID=2793071 RepID=A0A934PTA5_9SPHI|nr:PAS domain-containing protein [Mucilaginibacter segetis]MBK0378598.1 PAS domain-containing protein [Mucilaginibacter segetis]